MADVQRVTFGVELEFLVAMLDGSDDVPESGDTRKAIQTNAFSDQKETWNQRAQRAIRDFLVQHGIAVKDGATEVTDTRDEVAQEYIPRSWVVETDGTVAEQSSFGYTHYGSIELKSPPLPANEDAFLHVQHVISLIADNFLVRVNPTTGFHVHVGRGAVPLEPFAVSRLAQMLWAGDGVLAQIHAPERCLLYATSIRQRGNLALGTTGFEESDVQSEPDNDASGEVATSLPSKEPADGSSESSERPEIPEQEVPKGSSAPIPGQTGAASEALAPAETVPEPVLDEQSFMGLPMANVPVRSKALESLRVSSERFPSKRTNPFTDAESIARWHGHGGGDNMFQHLRREWQDRPTIGCLDGLSHLLGAEDHQVAAYLVCHNERTARCNYNFNAYAPYADLTPKTRTRTTIEFREAAGTLDAVWIGIWAKICVGIVEFCLYSTGDTFEAVLVRLAAAESNPGTYDVIDFLQDIGRVYEAAYVEKKLRNVPGKWWLPCAPATAAPAASP